MIVSDPYPFEAEDEEQIRELEFESIDAFADQRITVGELVDEHESWRFGHVIVDEAQDLTAMQWRMIMRRVRGRSLTVVGDLAQRTTGAPGAWSEHLPPELSNIVRRDLTINYRSPSEINDVVVGLLHEIAPGVSHAQAIRRSGRKPLFVQLERLDRQLDGVLTKVRGEIQGQIAVIAADIERLTDHGAAVGVDDDDLHWLTPAASKGLEFDVVVVVEPTEIWDLAGGGAHLYVALTRPTQHLVVVYERPLPAVLEHCRLSLGENEHI